LTLHRIVQEVRNFSGITRKKGIGEVLKTASTDSGADVLEQ